MTLVTLTTDFGQKDSYVAQMKGAFLSVAPHVQLVDICHQVASFDIAEGARMLAEATPCFPKGSIHVGVIDPGVGSQRERVILETSTGFFVGPDNGLFSLAAPEPMRAWKITRLDELPKRSNYQTFDGRNVFAPVAGLLATGVNPLRFGEEIDPVSLVALSQPSAPEEKGGELVGVVMRIDHYGNVITNISKLDLSGRNFSLPGVRLVHCYKELAPGELGMLFNSDNMLELCAFRQSAAELAGLKVGEAVCLAFA